MSSLALGAKWEIIKEESGKTWINPKAFTITAPCGEDITVPAGYEHDRASVVPDCDDNLPFIVHDFLYEFRTWDSGKKVRRIDADKTMRTLMEDSPDPKCQKRAKLYYYGVRCAGWWPWHEKTIMRLIGR